MTINVFTDKKLIQTPIREHLYNIMVNSVKPLTSKELLEKLILRKSKVNKTTVYRDLEIFCKTGIVREVKFDDFVARYEIAPKVCHHHLVCNACGKVEEFEINEKRFFDSIINHNSFKIENHIIEMFGRCGNCLN